jgi:hypothetical protein
MRKAVKVFNRTIPPFFERAPKRGDMWLALFEGSYCRVLRNHGCAGD